MLLIYLAVVFLQAVEGELGVIVDENLHGVLKAKEERGRRWK